MDKFYFLVEKLYKELNSPYVGTHHFLLAYLKIFPSSFLSFSDYKEHIIKIVGRCNKQSEHVVYTPKARSIRDKSKSIQEVIYYILNDKDSIAYHSLLSLNIEPSLFINS